MTLKLLTQGSSKAIYLPQNGRRSSPPGTLPGAGQAAGDIKEDMMELFTQEPDGRARECRRLMNRRGYLAVVPYDPAEIAGQAGGGYGNHAVDGMQKGGAGKLNLAVDFMVQGEIGGGGGAPGALPAGGGGQFGAAPSGGVGGGGAGGGGIVSKYGPVVIPGLEFGR